MKLIELKKEYKGKFLTYYIASYLNKDGLIKKYEFMSRNDSLTTESFGESIPKGVGIITLNEDKNKVLLEREFRLATNNFVINFPGGLIDEGETPITSAIRELKEETGLVAIEVLDCLPPSYALQATSDETMYTIILTAKGDLIDSLDPNEEITSKWYTKEEALALVKNGTLMSARVQLFIYMWANNKW